MPYEYRFHSPSLLLCAGCYDLEYDTNWSSREKWQRWLETLRTAGHFIRAYQIVGEEHRNHPMNEKERHRVLWNAMQNLMDVERVSIA
jgi:hypothetical protein